jgi:uncharacterized membrane protein
MKKLILTVLILVSFTSPIYAQMSTGQGGGMMGGSWGWGMGSGFGSGWFFMIIIAILVIFGIVYMMKRK